MIEAIPVEALGIGAGWVLVAMFVIMIMRGDLVPRRTYEDAVHDRNEWRAAHRISESARLEQEMHKPAMVEAAETMNQLMQEMQQRLQAVKGREAGGESR